MNQCDGCKRGNVPDSGMHRFPNWGSQFCTADRYVHEFHTLSGDRDSTICADCGEHVPAAFAMDHPRDPDAWVHNPCPAHCDESSAPTVEDEENPK